MKKIILGLAMLLSVTTYSQELLSTYDLSFFKRKYDISIATTPKDGVKFYIETPSVDKKSSKAILILKENEVENFKIFINEIKEIYNKWIITAKENNVLDLDKAINSNNNTASYSSGFIYGSYHFDFSTSLNPKFRIVNNQYLLVVSSGTLNSSSNQFIKSDGYSIAFSSENEINDFLKKIDITKAKEFFNSKTKKENIFKE